MHRISFPAFLLGVILLSSCSQDKPGSALGEKVIMANDFESVAGWNVDPANALDKGHAHSGQYAIKVDQGHEFSLTYDMALGLASPVKIKTVHLEAWAFLPSNKSTGVLSIQILGGPTNGDGIYGEGIRLGDVVKKYNEWVLVSQNFTFPDNITPLQHLRLFLWRADASDRVLIDDVKLTIKE